MAGRIWSSGTAAIAVLIATAIAPAARATTLAPLTIEQMTDGATWIVEGQIGDVWTEIDSETGRVWTRAALEVTDVWKGPSEVTSLVIDSEGGTSGAITTTISARAQFSEGEDVFVFLDVVRGGRLVPVAKFLGKYTIRRAAGETRKHAMTWHGDEHTPYDARFLPHPPQESRLYVDDLRDRVARRLAEPWDGEPIPGIDRARLEAINTPDRRLR